MKPHRLDFSEYVLLCIRGRNPYLPPLDENWPSTSAPMLGVIEGWDGNELCYSHFATRGFEASSWEEVLKFLQGQAILSEETPCERYRIFSLSEKKEEETISFSIGGLGPYSKGFLALPQLIQEVFHTFPVSEWKSLSLPFLREAVGTKMGRYGLYTVYTYRPAYTDIHKKKKVYRIEETYLASWEEEYRVLHLFDGSVLYRECIHQEIMDRVSKNSIFRKYGLKDFQMRLFEVMSQKEVRERRRFYRKQFPRHVAKRLALAERQARFDKSNEGKAYRNAQEEWNQLQRAFKIQKSQDSC